MKKIKIGVLGVGHLGKFHLNCIKMIPEMELVGFYDNNEANAKRIAEDYNIAYFNDVDTLLEAVDAVDIVTPTTTHFALAKKAIAAKKHIFIEKPVTETVEEAEWLLKESRAARLKVQVGHVERFNPALLSIADMPMQPLFIEAHRLAMFNPRGTDVSVVLDLMIHDLDIVLSLVKSKVASISASGVPVVSNTADIVNARIEFENGCVANLTASRISIKNMRKIRIFQPDGYFSLDFLEKTSQAIRLFDADAPDAPEDFLMEIETPQGKKRIHGTIPETKPTNAIQLELTAFAQSILHDLPLKVDIADGYEALKIARAIEIEVNNRITNFER
jgi:predicted dehydrogenase